MAAFPDIVVAYGESDEYSFVLSRKTTFCGNFLGYASPKRSPVWNILTPFETSLRMSWRHG